MTLVAVPEVPGDSYFLFLIYNFSRDYIGNVLTGFVKDNPQIKVEVTMKRGHPFVVGLFGTLNLNPLLLMLKCVAS